MTSISLNWYQRISLWIRVGMIQAPNMHIASVLYRVIEKIRPTDEERGETNLITRPGGYEWQLPAPDYGNRSIELESEEAELLARSLENPPEGTSVLVVDVGWILPLIEKLKKAKEAKEEELAAVSQ